jgi:hypothetical protein
MRRQGTIQEMPRPRLDPVAGPRVDESLLVRAQLGGNDSLAHQPAQESG